ncbi:MAG: DUF1491 family protein [Pseudomonadota bacterium]
MRLKSALWVSSYLKRVNQAGAFAAITNRGDESAGAVYLKINRLDGSVDFYAPALPGIDATSIWRQWELRKSAAPEPEIDAWLGKEKTMDPDLWIVEVEDKSGRCHLLDEELVSIDP